MGIIIDAYFVYIFDFLVEESLRYA